jgi:NAD-dependent dihydropyrimidine dehydrogenase PreA subunit
MTPAPPPARATARRILPSRAISAWLPKAATWTRSSLSKKENPFPAVCGHICDGLTLQTAQPDIFVGGDVATGPKFAIAAGKEAAISLHRYVHEGQSLTIGRNRRVYPELDKRNVALPTACFDAPVRQVPAALSGAEARKTFRDPRCTFTEEQVKMEASRCLGCGVSVVDTNRCIGCGVCTTRCEFDAIHLAAITRKRPR